MDAAQRRQIVYLQHLSTTLTLNELIPAPTAAEKDRVSIKNDGDIAIITLQNPPVNSWHPSVGEGLRKCYQQAYSDSRVKAIVLVGQGVFMAGADIAYMQKAKKGNPENMRSYAAESNKLLLTIEDGPKPTVAAIDGFALGGGLELAMSCSARVSTETAVLGLPELTLGLIPGFGGTQRLPRLVGVPKATEMILKSQNVKGRDAQKFGLVDVVVSNKAELVSRAKELALQIASGARPFNRTLKLHQKLEPLEMAQAVLGQARELVQKQAAGVVGPHPLAAVEAVAGCVANARDGVRGIAVEADQFMRCVQADSSSALMYLFFAKKSCAKVPGLAEAGVKPRQLRKFGIIGGGLMGSGIATAVLLSGGEVVLKEVEQRFLDAGVQRVRGNLEARVKRGAMTGEQLTAAMARLRPSLSYEPFRDVEVAIEAVFENLALKQQLFSDLEAACSPTCLLATNTSTIDIPSIGAKLKSPGAHERLVGLHFFSPAQVMPLLEIVRPPKASKQAVADALGVASLLGKTPIVVGNCPGFAANRIFFPYFQSAALLVDLGVDPYRIDKVLQAFGLPMGVFRLTDMIGVEVSTHVAQTFLDSYPNRVYPAAIYRLLLEAKRLGDRSGAGFYKHAAGKAASDPELQAFVAQSRAKAKIHNQAFVNSLTDKDILEMILFPVVNECARVLAEGMVIRASDLDVGAVLGYNWPASKGGPVFWATLVGGSYIQRRLHEWATRLQQPFFAPAQSLEKEITQASLSFV